MTKLLLDLPLGLLVALMVGLSVTATLVAASRRKSTATEDAGAALTALHATVSTIYTVLLAFVVVIVWQQFSDAETRVETEATRLSNLLRDSRAFSEPERTEVHDAIHTYIELATTWEWEAMAEGTAPDARTTKAYARIWETVYRTTPVGTVQEAFYAETLQRLNELGAARRTRLLSARASIAWVLWLLLIAGAVLVIYVSILLPTGSRRRERYAALAATTCVIALTLFVVFVFDHPYTGGIRVEPSPLTDLLSR